ncbi:MmpS family transport accessory protein [Mycolicibacterium aichiense]|uniref:MmpS family transport accessory protein n=1 Tax=Mycolicibacterium aichiense TaxID=1799 RepID=UPI003D66B02B
MGSAIFGLAGRLWIPLVVLIVVCAGGFTVSRLHGIFGNEKAVTYGDTRVEDAKPFNPKQMRYEVFGPPGTVAQISFFNGDGSPEYIEAASLPWTLTFPIVGAAGVGSVAAQGDSDSIGCRISIDGVVKSEKTSNQVNAFTSCMLKAA